MARSVKEADDRLDTQLESLRSSRRRRALVPPSVTLAFWRLRQAWGLLFMTAIGMIASVTLVCAVPLYSQIAATAGLRGILSTPPANADIVVYSKSKRISPSFIAQVTRHLDQEFHKNLGTYLGTTQFGPSVRYRWFEWTVRRQVLRQVFEQYRYDGQPLGSAACKLATGR